MGYSGSGAVLDLLKEFPELHVWDRLELSFIYKPDGLLDLGSAVSYSPCRYWSSDSAIRRFLKYMKRYQKKYDHFTDGVFSKALNEFIEELVQVRWKGSTSVHYYQAEGASYWFGQLVPRFVRSRLERVGLVFRGTLTPDKTMFYSYLEAEDFNVFTRKFVETIIYSLTKASEGDRIVLNQLFSANNPQKSFPFFNNPKAIVVNRDPRDIYLLAKKAVGFDSRFIPADKVEDFIVYYKGLMRSCSYDPSDERILVLNFEDLIYKYQGTKCAICDFLGISLSPNDMVNKQKYFDPNISIDNTQLWLKYNTYKDDIDKITDSLADYLYDFDKYEIKPKFKNKSF